MHDRRPLRNAKRRIRPSPRAPRGKAVLATTGGLTDQGGSYLAEGRPDTAYGTLLKARRRGESSHRLFVGLARAAMARRDLAAAEVWWQKAVASAPEDATCHLALGTCRYRLGKVVEAITSYRQALEIDPELDGTRVSLAIAYLTADCPILALDQAERQLPVTPDQIDMRLVRASALIQLGRPTEAIPDLTWLHQVGAKPAEAALLECEVNRALGDHETALLLAAELCEAFPTRPAPLRCFRETFANFMTKAPALRVNEFLDGLGLPIPATRLKSADPGPDTKVRPGRIDVVIPVHDGLAHLKACLASIHAHLSRTLGQIILVDDGCSTATRRWMRNAARAQSNLRIVQTKENSGFARALTLGLSHSNARQFVALNSDCVVGPGWLEKLRAAMPPGGRVAMVGPLSNAAAWQNLGEVFDPVGNYADHPMPDTGEIARIQARLGQVKVFAAPGSALVHGFCVLADRQIYDALGGLDLTRFPFGYGEFQDLSLRALDAGYDLRIADDCFVGHARGGSIVSARRAELSRDARRILYQRHTALRYLSAECSAAANRQIALVRRRCRSIALYCPGDPVAITTPARLNVRGAGLDSFLSRRVCIFVAFSPDGHLLPYTRHYLNRLKAKGFDIILMMNGDSALPPPPEALALARIVVMRDNLGFDFGAWRDALVRFPGVWDAELVLFTNDSIIGPFGGFDRIVDRIVKTPAPLFFLTESEFAEPHFQTFFWGLKGAGLRHPVVREFLTSIRDLSTKTHAIFLYEVFLRQVCETLAGLASFCLFPLTELSGIDGDLRPSINPTHHLWRALLRAGFPFLKGDFCRMNPSGAAANLWLREVEASGGDSALARLHVEALRLQRAVPQEPTEPRQA
jgi:GT2 family glycosyltransferase